MSSDWVIRVSNLGKSYQVYPRPQDRLKQSLWRGRRQYYREFWALRDVSFEVQRGETLGVMGRNGSGKSTLLQLVCGTLTPTQGTIEIRGRVAALLELGAGFNPEFTGRENVDMNAAIMGLSQQEIAQRREAIFEFADIGDFVDQPVKTYSSGMYVRLAFAVIANIDADILIIDEALSVGDIFFTQKCMRFLRRFREKGTILFVSHDTGAVINLCNRGILLEKGQIKKIGIAEEVSRVYLAHVYEESQGPSQIRSEVQSNSKTAEGITIQKWVDARWPYINASHYRNDIEIFRFKEEGDSFGTGQARVLNVYLLNDKKETLAWTIGGEMVTLQIDLETAIPITTPIVGFIVKDRLGQALFGDNTHLTYLGKVISVSAGQKFKSEFSFQMPILMPGDYTITAAVGEGTLEEHVIHQWRHDALVFKSHASSASAGLVGIPMHNIRLEIIS